MTNCQPASTSPALEAQGIVKQFIRPGQSSPVTALSGVSLTVRTGSLTAIIGPDGAGKTTFMRLVCGLMEPTAGRLTVCGLDVTRTPQAVQDQLSYMPQKFGLYEDLTVAENLELYADLHGVPQAVRDAVFDIRISVDKPVLLCCGDRILFLREDGDTAQYFSQNNVTATREDVEEIFLRLCGYSVYSHMEEIRGGFVSADRALRVGIGGTAVIEKGGIKTVRDVTSLSVRIPREKRGCAEEVLRYGVDLSRGLLLAGAPSSGKTTLLRDIARYIGTAGHRVVVLDERFELSADGFDLGACTDILQGYPKQEGLSHAVRCLSPEYIVCDELGENDFSAIRAASFSGVALIASIHAGSVRELCCRPLCRGILSLGAFETVALLHGRSAPTKVEKLFLAGDLLENNGGDPDCSVRGDRRVIGICAAKNA